MPSRRRFLALGSVGIGACAGCLDSITAPDIPRQTQILNARPSVGAGQYRAWDLARRVDNAAVSPVDETLTFSYEFTVEKGPPVLVAVTSEEELDRRDTGANYRVSSGTRTYGERGSIQERMWTGFLEVLVVDNRYIGPENPPPERSQATLHLEAYLNSPDGE